MAKKQKKSQPELVALQSLAIEYVPVDFLQPNEYNPNRQSEHEFELLKRSIAEDGFTQPVICLPDGRIVDGEHRWRAMKALGKTEIPVVKVDMTEAQRRVATIRHNMARGSHDVELTAQVFKDLEQLGVMDWAKDAMQLTDIEVERMLKDMTPLDEYGQGDTYNNTWEYSKIGHDYEGGDAVNSDAAMNAAGLPKDLKERDREMQRRGMSSADAQVVKRNFTFTKPQEEEVRKATGDRPAEVILAMVQAHTVGKEMVNRGEWTTLTFVVPTMTLLQIEQELERLTRLAPNQKANLAPELQRGLALEYMAALSSQTPDESIQA